MDILGLIALFLRGINLFIEWSQKKELLDQAEAIILSQQLQRTLDDVKKVQDARTAAHNRIANDPDSLRRPEQGDSTWNPDDLG